MRITQLVTTTLVVQHSVWSLVWVCVRAVTYEEMDLTGLDRGRQPFTDLYNTPSCA